VDKEVQCLRYLIGGRKGTINLEWISGIITMPLPTNIRELRRFLGLVGCYR
jgi:hypothetical protein